MELKHEVKTIIKVDGYDLDDFVNEQWPDAHFSYAADQEAADDASQEFRVDGELTTYDMTKILEIQEGTWFFSTNIILNYFAGKGMIPKGDYVIENYV